MLPYEAWLRCREAVRQVHQLHRASQGLRVRLGALMVSPRCGPCSHGPQDTNSGACLVPPLPLTISRTALPGQPCNLPARPDPSSHGLQHPDPPAISRPSQAWPGTAPHSHSSHSHPPLTMDNHTPRPLPAKRRGHAHPRSSHAYSTCPRIPVTNRLTPDLPCTQPVGPSQHACRPSTCPARAQTAQLQRGPRGSFTGGDACRVPLAMAQATSAAGPPARAAGVPERARPQKVRPATGPSPAPRGPPGGATMLQASSSDFRVCPPPSAAAARRPATLSICQELPRVAHSRSPDKACFGPERMVQPGAANSGEHAASPEGCAVARVSPADAARACRSLRMRRCPWRRWHG